MSAAIMTGEAGEHIFTHPLAFREAVAEALWAARNLARNRGYAVFPCRLPDKRPCCPRGFKDAMRDPEAIERLWRLYPGDLVGVATGEASGITALDIDVKHNEARAWWIRNKHRIPATKTFRTLSGGAHLYFQCQPEIGCSTSRVCTGIDTRGNGGYVVFWYAAGFACLDETAPAPWPAWITPLVNPIVVPKPAYLQPREIDPDKRIAGIVNAVRGAREKERNNHLYWGARRLAEIGAPNAEAMLMDAAQHIGLPAIEASKTIQSGMRGARHG